VLLWIINFMNLLCAYFLANWLPVVMSGAGHSASQAVLAGTMLWVGGVIGNLLLGWLVDRRGFGLVLSLTFLVAAIAIASIGQVAGSLAVVFIVIGVAGFCVLGAQSGLNALGAPPIIRFLCAPPVPAGPRVSAASAPSWDRWSAASCCI
jgi:AAHS family 4-hydroxybenzoate transporter-like MFS transporter